MTLSDATSSVDQAPPAETQSSEPVAAAPATTIQQPQSLAPMEPRGSGRASLFIAICAMIVACASLPPVWARLVPLSADAVARVRLAVAGPADEGDPQSTATVMARQADELRTLFSESQPRSAIPPVAAVASEPGAAQATPIETQDALARVETLRRAVDAMRKTVEGLEQVVERMRGSERRLALTLILQSATRDGRPFVTELEWLRRSASDEVTAAAVDVLLPYARRGVATVADLRDALFQSELADAVRRAAVTETSYIDRLQRGIVGWMADFGIAQKPKPLDTDAILEEARLAIARGQIAEATAAVQRLEGPPSTLMAPWVARAKVRLLIDEMVQRLLQSSAGPG
jgi:Mitochondrial inner membrane protein